MDKVGGFGILGCGLSDHLMTYVSRGVAKGKLSDQVFKKVRSFKSYSAAKLNSELSKTDWGLLLSSDNVNFLSFYGCY